MSQSKQLDALIGYIVSAQTLLPLSTDAKAGLDMLVDVQQTLRQEDRPVAVAYGGKFYCLSCRSFVSQEQLNAQILHPGWTIECSWCKIVLAPITLQNDMHATQPLQGAVDQNIEEQAVNKLGDKLTLRIEDNAIEDIHAYRVIWHNDGYHSMRYHCDTAVEARTLFEALQIVIAYDEL